MTRHRFTNRWKELALALAPLTLLVPAGLLSPTPAAAAAADQASPGLPGSTCNGNGVIRDAPVDCVTIKNIAGSRVTARVQLTVNGDATVTFTIDRARFANTPVRARWHIGKSTGALDNHSDVTTQIPHGQLSAVIHLNRADVCDGQLDTKFFYVGAGDSRGRVAAPWVRAPRCSASPSTTTPPATTTPTTPPSGPATTPAPRQGGTTSTTLPVGARSRRVTTTEAGPRCVSATPKQCETAGHEILYNSETLQVCQLAATGFGLTKVVQWTLVLLALGGFFIGTVALSRRPRHG
jgi:hypothetical protein